MYQKLVWVFFFTITVCSITASAQNEKVDSILSLLQAAPKQGRVDTVLLKKINPIFNRTTFTDVDVKKIVDEATRFKTGNDEDMFFLIHILLFNNLRNKDNDFLIDFGKLILEKIQKSNTPEKKYFRNFFLLNLRVPYRNSTRLVEGLKCYNTYLNNCIDQNDSLGIAVCSFGVSGFYRSIGLLDRALYQGKKSIAYLDSSRNATITYFGLPNYGGRRAWVNNFGWIGEIYFNKGDTANAIKYYRNFLEINQKLTPPGNIPFALTRLAIVFLQADKLDSATYLVKYAYDLAKTSNRERFGLIFQTWSSIEFKKKNFGRADSLLVKACEIIKELNIPVNSPAGIIDPYYYKALIRIEQKKYGEAAQFLLTDISQIKNLRNETLRDYKLLGEVYDKMGDKVKANESYKKFIRLQDSLLADQSKFSTISFEAEQQMNEKELSISRLKSENKISSLTRNFSIGIIALVLLLAGVVYYRYKSKKKANAVLEKTLTDLKSAQSQLIQSEKMASLGELTAGIAHEIQNPLNFVNNFSEVNKELAVELEEEIDKGNYTDAKAIAKDIRDNEEKINHHGKRADAIVKGMLQHSSSGSGKKEPTGINALCDEYLRLAYYGLKAKDKSFNATMQTDFDESIGNINIIPQDIGRVVLNLINNAFYAVDEKKKSGIENYEPTVSVSTKKVKENAEIKVADNGNGIPPKILDKIFQPFFTTKPTGQGTGLGLSLSYDIVKAHGGELKVETIPNQGSSFTIQLPV
jgi:signal transduction histidine kinase